MATIAIRMAPEHSGTMGTFALARKLRERGHRVVYLTTSGFAPRVTSSGFEVEVIPDDDSLPGPEHVGDLELRGPLSELADRMQALAESPDRPARLRRAAERIGHKALRLAVEAAELRRKNQAAADLLTRLQPQLALIDSIVPWATIPFVQRRIPVVNVNPTLVSSPTLAHPHIRSTRLPSANRWATALFALAELPYLRHALGPDAAAWFGWYPLAGFSLPRELRRHGIALEPHEFGFRPRLPELVTMPEAFDFPAARGHALRFYAGSSIDLARVDPPFDWSSIRAGKPLAYCSLGTQVWAEQGAPLYRAVIDAFRPRREWELVIAAGGNVPAQLGPLPSHVHVVEFAPQLELLARARLFITHAGPASIREAIHFGVPMVAVPCGGDQYGLAARIQYHGLGRFIDVGAASGNSVAVLVDAVLRDPRIARSMQRMQAACAGREELERAVTRLERHLPV